MSERDVAVLLGGPKVLGKGVTDPAGLANAIEAGLPIQSLILMKALLDLTDQVMASHLGMSPKTLSRLKGRKHADLTLVASDRLYRLARVFALAREVFESDDAVRNWLRSPQLGLGHRVPLDLLATGIGTREVEALLGRIEYGVLA